MTLSYRDKEAKLQAQIEAYWRGKGKNMHAFDNEMRRCRPNKLKVWVEIREVEDNPVPFYEVRSNLKNGLPPV